MTESSQRKKKKPRKTKTKKPKRSYRSVVESLSQVWRIEHVDDNEALWSTGEAELSHLPTRPLKVAVWNLFKGHGSVQFEHDYRMLLYQSDLLLAQEALLSMRAMRNFWQPGFQVCHAASYRRRDGLRDGVMTVARSLQAAEGQRILCQTPEPIMKTPKAALVSRFPLEGTDRTLLVINLHATLVRTQKGAIEEMVHLLERLPAHDGPVLMGGDFNTFTKKYLNGIVDLLHQVGLNFVPIPDDPRPTLGALDQVFVKGLKTEKIYVDTTIKNSDHYPILCEFRLE